MSNSTIDSSSSRSLMQHLETSDRLSKRLQSSSQTNSTQGSGTGSNSVSVSGFSQVINQLQDLATSDPTQFKQQSADIASQLNAVASQTSGSEAQIFQNLASQFQQASQTGEVPQLALHHQGRHHHGGSTVTSNAATTSGAGNATSAASTTMPQIAQNANGFYGPENATDPITAAIAAGAAGLQIGQTYYSGVPGWGLSEVV
ncbi:MAG: hypothetical protein ABSC08_01200 [Bryobacteraceae bacterium]